MSGRRTRRVARERRWASCTSTSAAGSPTSSCRRPRPVSTLDLLGPGYTLFTGAHDGRWSGAVNADAPGAPVAVREVGPVVARALGVRGDGALMVRPDGLPDGEPVAA